MKNSTNSKWELSPKIDKNSSKNLSQYPLIIRQLLFARGIKTKTGAKKFFAMDDKNIHNSSKLYNANAAAKLILAAIKDKKKIYIHGDFDVDGICSTSILWDLLYRKLKADAMPYIPSRFDEGYGMSDESISNIKKSKGDLVITVDCGIKDEKLISKWSKKGLDFIVTDHHELKKEKGKVILPKSAKAIVHPRYPRKKYPFVEISGATVVWKLACEIIKQAKIDINPDTYLDLVALSIVCDIMPLVDENRILLAKGLDAIRKTSRPGLIRLISDALLEQESIEAYHLGFILGPRLNAAGRLDHALDAMRLLVTNSKNTAREISSKLNSLNQTRQNIQEKIYKKALQQIEMQGIEKKLYFVWADDWEEGVIGIVAGKISESFHRPVLIATRKADRFTGSARSISAFNIIDAINSQSDLLERFGGHPLAAGFTVKPELLEQFRDNLLELADQNLGNDDIKKVQKVDCEIKLRNINWQLVKWIDKFAPFGFGNTKPKFVLKNVKATDVRRVGSRKDHLQFAVLIKETGEYIRCIGFGLGDKYDVVSRDEIDILFTLEVNEWNGNESLQLNVKEVKSCQ